MSKGAVRVVALTVATSMLFAGSADAAKEDTPKLGSVKTRSATGATVSGNQAISTATATCPKGHRALGGGFQGTPPSTDVLNLVYESQRVGQKAWRASSQGADSDSVGSFSITAFVYCAKGTPKAKTVSATSPTPVSSIGAFAAATCPKGRVALGGGYSSPPPALAGGAIANFVIDSAPVGTTGWQSRVVAGPIQASSITSYVYCAKSKQVPVISLRSGTPAASSTALEFISSTASCGGKRTSIAGGFTQSNAGPSNLALIYESQKAGGSWRTSALHAGGNFFLTLTSHSLCG